MKIRLSPFSRMVLLPCLAGALTMTALVLSPLGWVSAGNPETASLVSAQAPAPQYELIPELKPEFTPESISDIILSQEKTRLTTVGDDELVQLSSNSSDHSVWIGQMLPWGVDRIDTTLVSPGNQGKGVKIAILDTGIDLDHPDLKVAGNVSFVADAASGDDDNGHGTIIAGIIGAQDNNVGIIGVAPQASLYAVKVIGKNGEGHSDAIVKGIEWSIENKMQIINLSFGDPLPMAPAVVDALEKAYQAGILIIAGAGNDGESTKVDSTWYPAHYDTVIAVGSTDQWDRKAPFSSVGPSLELMAPGVGVVSCNQDGSYSRSSGTSFSAAFVSGAAALLFASGVDNNQQVRNILQTSAEDQGTAGWDSSYGYGLVNAHKAILKASEIISSDSRMQ